MSLPHPVSTKTIRRQLHILEYEYRVKLKEPFLTKTHKQKHLAWCQRHKDYITQNSMNTIFSDENTYYVLERKNKL